MRETVELPLIQGGVKGREERALVKDLRLEAEGAATRAIRASFTGHRARMSAKEEADKYHEEGARVLQGLVKGRKSRGFVEESLYDDNTYAAALIQA